MTVTTSVEIPALTVVAFPRAAANGLWDALVTTVGSSAAGSRLVEPDGFDQPISTCERSHFVAVRDAPVVMPIREGMFHYVADDSTPAWDPDVPPAAA